MEKEDLLKPRYKVIADYPGGQRKVGDIISMPHPDYDDGGWIEYHDGFPHLFKKLEWWEERKAEDMPDHVKLPSGRVDKVKISMFYNDPRLLIDGKLVPVNLMQILPATEEEFLNQQK